MTTRLKTLLIVDDDEGMRDTLTAILKRDYRALAVGSAEAALPVLRNEPVDLLLLDVRLPGMNGIEMLKLVKEQYALDLLARRRQHVGPSAFAGHVAPS